jgi:hypothetical protein
MADRVITFTMTFNHDLKFEMEGENLIYDKSKQDITLEEFSIFPSIDLDKMEIITKYEKAAEVAVADSVKKIKTRFDKSGRVARANIRADKTADNVGINNKKRSFNVVTNRLNVSKQFTLDSGAKQFVYEFNPKEITKFINYVQSKKIKIFIDGNEIKPKNEIEFLKEVIPNITAATAKLLATISNRYSLTSSR